MGGGTSRAEPSQEGRREPDFTRFKARVDRVYIAGLQRTHDDYVQRAARHLFKAQNFQDVIVETANVKDDLLRLGIYKNLRISIDTSKGEGASKNGYTVTFTGEELSRITGNVGVEVGQNDGAATTELVTPNLFGRGERLSLNLSRSYVRNSVVNIKLTKPFYHTAVGDYEPETSITVFRNASPHPWSKYRLEDNGALLDFSFAIPSLGFSNSLQYELGMKELFALDKQTPFFVREHCGPRLVSTFRYIGQYEGRDDSVFPSSGVYAKGTTELIGSRLSQLGIVRQELHAELNVPLFLGASVQLCGRIGAILQDKRKESLPINQLFFPGGPQTLRGFELAGACPRRDGIAAGCRSYWTTGLHLWSPLPFNQYFGGFGNLFRTHAFYNIGTCDTYTTDKLRSTAGIGIAFRMGQKARIEFNYCQPLSYEAGDRVVKGFQFGIGYEFV
ncbi:SAM50-like protein CG7639 [Anopheles arabiensis]|uniref:Bacterial surface antigen (D15) domain-containing protein n=2 Tax=gambiae species complex TaxID=44542 RepID=A0A182HZY1_ANOAR|nr:SAM50-like protein CG7639 [Anopheles gambiae]XP_040151513.1 SAM50-like protein CG7639 [Anopheles arabiensis]